MAIAAHRLGLDDPDDLVFYPDHDDMGESTLQCLMIELLRPLIAHFLASQGIRAFVGADQFIYWIKGNPKAVVAPDVYVLPGVDPDVAPRCWKLWEEGVPPSFALEIMAEENDVKDLVHSPQRHDELGTRELVVFDPYVEVASGRTRFRIHRRNAQGKLVLAESTNADRIWSVTLGCAVRVVGQGGAMRLRLATTLDGEALIPTASEEAREARAAFKEERAMRQSLEAELAALRAEVERLRR